MEQISQILDTEKKTKGSSAIIAPSQFAGIAGETMRRKKTVHSAEL